jgi:cardiolipin synthase
VTTRIHSKAFEPGKTSAKWLRRAFVTAVVIYVGGCTSPAPLSRGAAVAPPVRSLEFRQALGSLVGSGFCSGNTIYTLNNGDEIFPAMLAAISSAKGTINFETFVYDSGEIPDCFALALEERARAGVRVHVILDAVGAGKSAPYHAALRNAGVELVIYHSPWWLDVRRNNYRTHRKLLIVDGKVGFIGGVGIADLWKGKASSPKEWRDLHYQVKGPVVAQLQAAFEDNWMSSRRELLLGSDYFPALAPTGQVAAAAFFSSPFRGRSSLEIMYHIVIASARRSLLIETPYFLPDRTLIEALCAAARRGVLVRIILPGKYMDQKAVQRHSRKTWPRLIAAGVKLYEYEPTMIHSKLLIADGLFVSVGSGNLDPRSLRINDEANLNVLDAAFAREQTRIFQKDLLNCRPVNLRHRRAAELVELPRQTVETPLASQL